MIRRILFVSLASLAITLFTASDASAWVAFRAGYTHVGPFGAYQVGARTVATPYGARTVEGFRAVGPGGYRYGYVGGVVRPPVVGEYRPIVVPGPVVLPAYRPGVYRIP